MKRLLDLPLALVTLGVGAACVAAYRVLGAPADGNGLLHEPFSLVGIGSLCLILGAAIFTSAMVRIVIERLAPTG